MIAATHASFWKHEHSMAPVVSLGFAVLLGALVLRRVWACWLLVVFEAATLVSFAFDFSNPLGLLLNLASFALVVSPPMRSYVHGG